MSSERFAWAVLLAAVPSAVALVASPPDPYARAILGGGTLVGCLPLAYLVAGMRG
jgi:hypothetical protein